MNSKRIVIKDVLKTNLAVSSDKAIYISQLMHEAIEKEESIVLDFSGIKSLTTAFLNTSVGELYKDYDSELLNKYIKFDTQTLSSLQMNKVRLVMSNSKEKYSEEYKKRIDEVTLHGDVN